MSIPAALRPLTVLDPDGRVVPVADLWRHRPVVLVWIRHYG